MNAHVTHPYPSITVEELRSHLSSLPGHYTIDFCGLDFYRIKARGDEHVQMEFAQPVSLDQETGRVVVENLDPEDPAGQ